MNNDNERIDFYQIEGYNHQNAPSFLLSHEASKLMRDFLKKVLIESRKDPSGSEYEWEKYHKNLSKIGKFVLSEKTSATKTH